MWNETEQSTGSLAALVILILEQEMSFRRELNMIKVKWNLYPDHQRVPHLQPLRTTGDNIRTPQAFGSHPKCPYYIQSFLKPESVLARECYAVVSSTH